MKPMPPIRLIGNAALSFMSKLSSGYWDIFDPTNGYTAIHRGILAALPLDKISSNVVGSLRGCQSRQKLIGHIVIARLEKLDARIFW